MVKVSNRACIRRLGLRSMRSARTRNLIAIAAIALTAVLFTTLFTIAMSLNDAFQEANFRMVGGYSHGGFKYLTEEQVEELKDDPLIKEYGTRHLLGMVDKVPFNKSQVEVSYMSDNDAKWSYCVPTQGRLPAEGTDEAATDTRILELLGVEPELGATFTLPIDVDGRETQQTFTLCGWWEYDEAVVANQVLLPDSRVDAVLEELGVRFAQGSRELYGSWGLDVMVGSALHIERDLLQVLENHGYQSEGMHVGDNFIAIGVNWGYSGAQLLENLDLGMLLAIVVMLALIVFTGYLIIYNVFQISVTNDIRFYGLLKTIGTTPRQLKRIVRQQALTLSLVGIPLGLLIGWLVGGQLTPVIVGELSGLQAGVVSANPVIFLGSGLFALGTVLLSCSKPARIAAKVSPIEALRYTEGGHSKKKARRTAKTVPPFSMARANLGRSRGKTVLTVLSLSLAVVLTNLTVTFTGGFDMDKYLARNVVSDFIVSDAEYLRVGGDLFSGATALPQEAIAQIQAQGGIAEGGRIYGRTSTVEEEVTEAYYRQANSRWSSPEELDDWISTFERTADGNLLDTAQLYGMEPFALDHLGVVDGDLSKLYEPGGNYVAAVYFTNDYGEVHEDSHWAKVGETVTLRYVDQVEYYNQFTGEIYEDGIPETGPYRVRTVAYHEVDYIVAARVTLPSALSYRYYGSDEFILNDQTFIRDTGTDAVMLYAFDMESDGANDAMEAFLADYTGSQNAQYDYESKATYVEEFESFRSMFLMLGGALSFIVGLVGVLNFFNAILTGIISRRREFAMLQSVGMTGRQLKTMLVCEGLFYALGAIVFALVLFALTGPLAADVLGGMFWFFTYRFTVSAILVLSPLFALLGCVLPLVVYRSVAKRTIVERLREIE